MCGIAATLIFALLVTVSGAMYEGYSHASQAISELGGVEAQEPLIQNLNFVVVGLLVIAFAFGLHQGIGQGRGSRAGPFLIGLFGVSAAVAQPLLPCDPGCEFETATGAMHNLTGMAGFLAAIAGIFLVARRINEDPRWRSHGSYSLFTSLAALTALVLWIGVSKVAGVDDLNGVLQRVFIGIVLLWIGVIATRIFWFSHQARQPSVQLGGGEPI